MSHGNTIVEVIPCGVHPLHLVKVRASGARDGCPMCEMQIEDVCRSFTPPRTPLPPRDVQHAPQMTQDLVGLGLWTRIVGCTCGWRTPLGTTDSDNAFASHVAIAKAGEQP